MVAFGSCNKHSHEKVPRHRIVVRCCLSGCNLCGHSYRQTDSDAEQLGLRPIDPTPIAVAFTSPDAPVIHAKNVIEPKDWELTRAEFLPDGFLEMNDKGSTLSPFFPVHPGCYFVQIDQKTIGSIAEFLGLASQSKSLHPKHTRSVAYYEWYQTFWQALFDPQSLLHFFERNLFGFGHQC